MHNTQSPDQNAHQTGNTPSVLTTLRALLPQREASFAEALRVAEQQAHRFLSRLGASTTGGPISDELLLDLPRITIEYIDDMPTSGCSFWDAGRRSWIQINTREALTRQRFTMFHEYKHIVDHGRTDQLYGTGNDASKHAEQAADYFAGCVLMPRPLVKRAWCQGIQTAQGLANWFDVSSVAARVRLAQIGLADEPTRCAPPQTKRTVAARPSFQTYYRQFTPRPLILQELS